MATPAVALPNTTEVVTREVLRLQGLNANAFSGSINPKK